MFLFILHEHGKDSQCINRTDLIQKYRKGFIKGLAKEHNSAPSTLSKRVTFLLPICELSTSISVHIQNHTSQSSSAKIYKQDIGIFSPKIKCMPKMRTLFTNMKYSAQLSTACAFQCSVRDSVITHHPSIPEGNMKWQEQHLSLLRLLKHFPFSFVSLLVKKTIWHCHRNASSSSVTVTAPYSYRNDIH